MNDNAFFVRLPNKVIVFVRTDTGRFFKISDCLIDTDGHIDENDGLVPGAIEVRAQNVAELYARFGVQQTLPPRTKTKRKASKIKKLRKEEATV